MPQSTEYLGVLVTLVLAAGIAGAMLVLNAVLGPKNKMTPVKAEPFECGLPNPSVKTGQFSVKFYLTAMLFILFDVEIVWFFPWAVVLKSLRWEGIALMFTFVAVLVLAYVYAWRKGALEWER
jgi:NADH-quinone oxidoreductase subunit A